MTRQMEFPVLHRMPLLNMMLALKHRAGATGDELLDRAMDYLLARGWQPAVAAAVARAAVRAAVRGGESEVMDAHAEAA